VSFTQLSCDSSQSHLSIQVTSRHSYLHYLKRRNMFLILPIRQRFSSLTRAFRRPARRLTGPSPTTSSEWKRNPAPTRNPRSPSPRNPPNSFTLVSFLSPHLWRRPPSPISHHSTTGNQRLGGAREPRQADAEIGRWSSPFDHRSPRELVSSHRREEQEVQRRQLMREIGCLLPFSSQPSSTSAQETRMPVAAPRERRQ
jgi:hypothetical protein